MTTLETGQVSLDPLLPKQFKEILDWDIQPRQSFAVFKNPLKLTHEKLGLMVRDPNAGFYTISHQKQGLVGLLGYTEFQSRQLRAQISLMVNPLVSPDQRSVEDALAVFVKHLFSKLKIRKLQSFFLRADANWEKALIRIGAKKEGILKEHFFLDGKYFDVLVYRLFPEEFQ